MSACAATANNVLSFPFVKNKTSTLLLIAILLLSSCNTYRYTYAPEPVNNPVFTEKGQSNIAASFLTNKPFFPSPNHYANGFNVQAAYAITNHIAATYSYTYKTEKDNNGTYDGRSYFDSTNTLYKRYGTELAVGGFWFLGDKKDCLFSVYGGYGFGSFNIVDKVTSNSLSATRTLYANTHKFFLQPSFSFREKYFNVSLVSKMSLLQYGSIRTDYLPGELEYYKLDKLQKANAFVFEPSLNVQIKLPHVEWLSLNGGGGLSFNNARESHRWSYVYAGIGIDPFRLIKKKR